MRLGIDFGTTRTVVAAAIDGRYPVAAFESSTGYCDYIPGIAARKGGELTLGWDAELSEDVGGALRSIKRAVSRVSPDEPLGALGPVSALELTTRYLQELKRRIYESSNLDVAPGEPLEAMVAVPANADTRQRYLTLDAFRRAGFEVLGMVNEPTAAAIEFAHRNLGAIGKRSPKRYVVVYDLGGGTFDTSAVSLQDRRFELITSEGISELGGDDFDAAILRVALREAGIAESSLKPLTRTRLLEVARVAKESLGPSSRKLLIELSRVIPGAEDPLLDVNDIYTETEPLVERTIALLDRVFASLTGFGIDPENPRELGAVYLVGGGTAFPAVTRALRERYKRKVQLAPQAHAATAIGLAIAADPDAELFVREAVTRHFGVWREGDAGRDKVFDPILRKGELPDGDAFVIERVYRPQHAVGHLRFLECSELSDGGQPCGDLTPWGDIYFPYDPALRGVADLAAAATERRPELWEEEIVERYKYAADGTVTIAIENRTRGYAQNFVLGAPGLD